MRPEGEGPDIPPDSVADGPAALNRMQNGDCPAEERDREANEMHWRPPDASPGMAPNRRAARTGARESGTERKSPRRRNAAGPAVSIADIPDAIWERFRRPLLAAILETATDAADGRRAAILRQRHASNGNACANGKPASNGPPRKPKPK